MKIIALGASAGGIQALRRVLAHLEPDLQAAVFVVVHIPSNASSVLPQILNKVGPFSAVPVTNGEAIRPGRIYVAPPDHHLLIGQETIRLTRGPRENRNRPAIDPLFRSAAKAFGPNVIGVVLSGAGSDGALGLKMIKEAGGTAVIQEPSDCIQPIMPLKARAATEIDYSVSADKIGQLISRLVGEGAAEAMPAGWNPGGEPEEEDEAYRLSEIARSKPSQFACPECHGVLWQIEDSGNPIRYRCRIGHAYTSESLLDDHSQAVDAALSASFRALEERASLLERMGEQMTQRGALTSAKRFLDEAKTAHENADVLASLLRKDSLFRPEGDEESTTEAINEA